MLYHRDVGFPKDLSDGITPDTKLTYTRHALRAAEDERLGRLPQRVPEHFDVIEVEVVNKRVTKSVIRFRFTLKDDLVLVVLPDGVVKTVWVNAHTDSHRTLNTSRYARVS